MNFLLAVILAVVLSKVLSEFFERIGLVSLLGEYGAGLILGISLLGIMRPHDIETFAIMGVVLLMFLAGYEETDLKFLIKHERKFFFMAALTLVSTLAFLLVFSFYYLSLNLTQALFFAFIFGLTDVAVGAKTLFSMGKADTDVGRSMIAIGVIDTILGVIFLAIVIAIVTATSVISIVETIGGIGLFFVVVFVMSRYLPRLVDNSVKMRTEEIDFSIAIVSVFLLAFLAEELGVAAVLGAYFAGVILQKSGDLRGKQFSTTIKTIAYGFFVSIFFVWMGLQANLQLLSLYLKPAVVICVVAMVSKALIMVLVSKLRKLPVREGIIYGVGMSAKGADNLIIVAIGASVGVLVGIDELLVTSLALTIIVSTILSSVLLKKLLK